MSVNLKKVTENFWVANASGTPIGLVVRSDTGFDYMTPELIQEFQTMDEVKTYLGGRVKEEMAEANDGLDGAATEEIEGFPVKHTNFSVEQAGDRPVYARGKTQHVAGYWCIKFSKRWVPSFCPLLRTVEQYQSAGPFKNRLEMMANLSSLNRSV